MCQSTAELSASKDGQLAGKSFSTLFETVIDLLEQVVCYTVDKVCVCVCVCVCV